jgi:lipopolysaccharide transport system ATP-binding protein
LEAGQVNNEPIVSIQNVSMRFNLAQEQFSGLKDLVIMATKGKLKFHEFYALKDVSFDIKRGESWALIGKNGCGKSTLLKVISGIYKPTNGNVIVRGTIAPLIELGAGFDMELTARENIFLNGAVLGHSRKVMEQHFDEIVEFSELKNFIDVPIKNFSSGMIARLGFSIATIVRADIIIIDEILAVGDYEFQKKCYKRMEDMMSGGTTVIFVSHDEVQVRKMCDHAVWLSEGMMQAIGSANDVCRMYKKSLE